MNIHHNSSFSPASTSMAVVQKILIFSASLQNCFDSSLIIYRTPILSHPLHPWDTEYIVHVISKLTSVNLSVASPTFEPSWNNKTSKWTFILISVRLLREELQLLQEQGSYVGEVVKPMDKKKVLVKVHPEGKFVVDIDKNIDINDVTPNSRVALRNESYTLHKILPNKVSFIEVTNIFLLLIRVSERPEIALIF